MSYQMRHFQMMKGYWRQLRGTRTFSYGMSHQEHTGKLYCGFKQYILHR
jgi:hypothetical protein